MRAKLPAGHPVGITNAIGLIVAACLALKLVDPCPSMQVPRCAVSQPHACRRCRVTTFGHAHGGWLHWPRRVHRIPMHAVCCNTCGCHPRLRSPRNRQQLSGITLNPAAAIGAGSPWTRSVFDLLCFYLPQVASKTDVARRWNHQGVLENHSLHECLEMLRTPGMDALSGTKGNCDAIIATIIKMVMVLFLYRAFSLLVQ